MMVVISSISRHVAVVLLVGVTAVLCYGHAATGDSSGGRGVKASSQISSEFPVSLPIGAVVPDVARVSPVPPDVYAGRVMALARTLQCPQCAGSGTKVTRHRDLTPQKAVPVMRQTKEDCGQCHGTGFSLNQTRVSPVLDSVVLMLGSIDMDTPAATKLLDKARATVVRLGCSGELAEKVTETSRNCITSGRTPRHGTACSVTGEVGRPIPIGGGTRLIPVKVSANSMVFLRAPVIHAVPSGGMVLAGGVMAGAIEKIEWQWGAVVVLDGGYLVPLTTPEHKGPGVDADKDGVIDREPVPAPRKAPRGS